jgi:hypothetical protein
MAVLYHQGKFPPRDIDWPRLLPLIGPANAAVARYEGVLHGIPNALVAADRAGSGAVEQDRRHAGHPR